MELNIKLILPVMIPLPCFNQQKILQDECLEEIVSLSGKVTTIFPLDLIYDAVPLSFNLHQAPEQCPLIKKIWKSTASGRKYKVIEVGTKVNIDFEKILADFIRENGEDKISPNELLGIVEDDVVNNIIYEIRIFILMSNIVRPGSISLIEGYSFIENECYKRIEPFYTEQLFFAMEASVKNNWPLFSEISIKDARQWLIDNKFIQNGIGIGSTGRALSALSYVMSESFHDNNIDLAWILLGLEALYTKNTGGLNKQLLEKTEVILGKRSSNKKAFGAMYDFRSRFLHGDIDVPLRFSEFDIASENFNSNLLDHEEIALAVLIATLQWMIKNKKSELNFTYELIE